MKILFLTEYFYPFAHGGSEWSTYYLVSGLNKKRIKTLILTPNYGSRSFESWQGIDIKRIPFFKKMSVSKPHAITPFWFTNIFFYLISFVWIFKEVIKDRIDILHVQGNYFLPPAIFAGWILKKPVVVTVRDYQILCPYGLCLTKKRNYEKCSLVEYFFKEIPFYVSNYTAKSVLKYILTYIAAFRARFVKYFLSFFLKKATKIICISKKQEKIFNKNGFTNTQTIYNPMQFRLQRYRGKKKDYILYVGRLTPGKGIRLLIESFNNLLKQRPKLKLVIIGEGFLKYNFKNLSGIKFLGQLPYKKTLLYMNKALVVVVPSIWEEPFGRVALEALACGTTAVVTRRGGLPEIIENNRTGYIVEPNQKQLKKGILKALKNNNKLQKNIRAMYPKIRRKFYTDVINSYIRLYKSL